MTRIPFWEQVSLTPLLAILSPSHSSPIVVKPQIVGVPEFLIQCFMWGDSESLRFYMFLDYSDACLGVTLQMIACGCVQVPE